jgi:predicted phosphoribosyltransferase
VLAKVRSLVAEIAVLHQSEWFFGIGQFYEQLPQVDDDEVIECLKTVRETLMPKMENRT